VDDERLRVLACGGLAVGAVLGMAGTFAPSPSVRSWNAAAERRRAAEWTRS
jgi:hypothetical protein